MVFVVALRLSKLLMRMTTWSQDNEKGGVTTCRWTNIVVVVCGGRRLESGGCGRPKPRSSLYRERRNRGGALKNQDSSTGCANVGEPRCREESQTKLGTLCTLHEC